MAEEEVAASPAPADHKRKLDEVEPEPPHRHASPPDGSNVEPDGGSLDDSTEASDSSQAKRPRLDEKTNGLEAQENGSEAKEAEEHLEREKQEEAKEEEMEEPTGEKGENQDGEPAVKEVQEPIEPKEGESKPADEEDRPSDDHKSEENQQASVEALVSQEPAIEESKEVNDGISQKEADETQSTTRRIEVPSSKVGVLIGKGGDTIRYLQFNSGAKIQILRDAEADPSSASRPVEIIGTVASIEKAEKLIQAVIAEADAGGSPSLVARGLATGHSIGVPEQIEIKVPNDKVGLIIGRGGETIKNMQTRSGARIQLIPQHAEGDGSKERTVRISGDKRQIDIATEMIKDVMYQNVRPSHYSGGFNQPVYRPRGPDGPPQWGSRGPHTPHPMPYDYHHRGGPYPSPSSHYAPPSYGGYPPQHMPPRSGFGGGWDQRPSHTGSYDYYGRQGSQTSAPPPAPASGHAPGPLPSPAMGPPPSQTNYGYGQGHGPEYGHAPPYSQAGPQQTYGQMYEQPKYENPLPVQQQPYGGHGGPQPGYPQAHGGQPGYGQPQQQGRPYGMQGPSPQAYGPPRAAPPGDMPYQSATPAASSYGTNMAPQQQYGYASSGSMQQGYPSYGSVAPSDGYGTQTPAAAPAYQQQGVQPVPAHDQPGGQQATAGYGQVPPTGGYSSYPSSQQAYGNNAAAQNSGNYGYPGTQEPSYGGGNSSAYGAALGGQPAYSQATPGQASYEQSASQSTGFPVAPGSAPVKSLSPQQAAYPQYDANQVYPLNSKP